MSQFKINGRSTVFFSNVILLRGPGQFDCNVFVRNLSNAELHKHKVILRPTANDCSHGKRAYTDNVSSYLTMRYHNNNNDTDKFTFIYFLYNMCNGLCVIEIVFRWDAKRN